MESLLSTGPTPSSLFLTSSFFPQISFALPLYESLISVCWFLYWYFIIPKQVKHKLNVWLVNIAHNCGIGIAV